MALEAILMQQPGTHTVRHQRGAGGEKHRLIAIDSVAMMPMMITVVMCRLIIVIVVVVVFISTIINIICTVITIKIVVIIGVIVTNANISPTSDFRMTRSILSWMITFLLDIHHYRRQAYCHHYVISEPSHALFGHFGSTPSAKLSRHPCSTVAPWFCCPQP